MRGDQEIRAVTNPGTLLRGVEYKVYQALGTPEKPGAWHAHVNGLQRGDLNGLRMRSASRTAHTIAKNIERKVSARTDTGYADEDALRIVLQEYNNTYTTTEAGPGWVDVGYCSTEDEARDRACTVIGHVFGRRLSRATASFTPEPVPMPAIREAKF